MVEWLCLVLVLLLVAYGNGYQEYTIDWTPEGLAKIGNNFSVDIGDRLTLKCPPNSYSNLIGLIDEEQYLSCNSSVADAKPEFRGYCSGFAWESLLILNIENPSARIPSDFGFSEGKISYLTSFSRGATLAHAVNDRVAGGDCSSGLRLALYVRVTDLSTTEEVATTTTTVSAETSTSSSSSSSNKNTAPTTIKQEKDDVESILSPSGLQSISGSIGQHQCNSSTKVLTSILLLFALRIIS